MLTSVEEREMFLFGRFRLPTSTITSEEWVRLICVAANHLSIGSLKSLKSLKQILQGLGRNGELFDEANADAINGYAGHESLKYLFLTDTIPLPESWRKAPSKFATHEVLGHREEKFLPVHSEHLILLRPPRSEGKFEFRVVKLDWVPGYREDQRFRRPSYILTDGSIGGINRDELTIMLEAHDDKRLGHRIFKSLVMAQIGAAAELEHRARTARLSADKLRAIMERMIG